jgi:hypothetical protein
MEFLDQLPGRWLTYWGPLEVTAGLFSALVEAKWSTWQYRLSLRDANLNSDVAVDTLDLYIISKLVNSRSIPFTTKNREWIDALRKNVDDGARINDNGRRPNIDIGVYRCVDALLLKCMAFANDPAAMRAYVRREWIPPTTEIAIAQAHYIIHAIREHDFSSSWRLGKLYARLWAECTRRGFRHESARRQITTAARRAATIVDAVILE